MFLVATDLSPSSSVIWFKYSTCSSWNFVFLWPLSNCVVHRPPETSDPIQVPDNFGDVKSSFLLTWHFCDLPLSCRCVFWICYHLISSVYLKMFSMSFCMCPVSVSAWSINWGKPVRVKLHDSGVLYVTWIKFFFFFCIFLYFFLNPEASN